MEPGERDHRLARDPVAIVGMAGLFPEAAGLGAFWDNIVAGRDCLREVPGQWWDPEVYFDPDPLAPDKTYARRGGFLTPQLFDPREFGMPPKSVDSVSLVQLLSLLVARDTLADAGMAREGWFDPERAGVVLGVAGVATTLMPLAARSFVPVTARVLRDLGAPEEGVRRFTRALLRSLPEWTEDSFPGTLDNVVAGRIANRFGLRGANHTVDAACASSLAAVRAAVDELLCRRADLMVTGGCDADNSIVSFLCFSKTPALSPSGRIRPFDADADGTLLGEGIGMLALKRLADAERAGDRIYAVLKGLGGSSDGRARSVYAPSGEGQLSALRRAYADAGCDPRSVQLVEAHGTGTAAGDATELATLETLLAGGVRRGVAVGSVKSQIGHTKAAAGAAGLIKTALALHQRVLPATLGVERPRPPAGAAESPVYVNTRTRPWLRDPARPVRRAGVSAFGFGGVNYHAVLEEHPAADRAPLRVLHRTPRACLWHAPDPRRLRDRLERGEPCDPGPVPAEHARIGFVAVDQRHHGELLSRAVAELTAVCDGRDPCGGPGLYYRARSADPGKVGALFAGQGGQYPGMGLTAVLAVPPLRAAFDHFNVGSGAGLSLADVVFPPPGGEAEAERALRRTRYAQPAVGALACGQYRFLTELGLPVDGVLGHSFGELTALWAAGVLDDDAFADLAWARGRALTPPPDLPDPGALAAVRLTERDLAQLLVQHGELELCNRNAPDEQVVGGPTEAVERFLDACRGDGVAARRLPVEAAFHTRLVGHAGETFAAACAEVAFAPPAVAVYADAPGARYAGDAAADRRTLAAQVRGRVDFHARVREMYDDGVRVFVEFGPRRTLAGLVRRTLAGHGDVEVVSCDGGPGVDGAVALKSAAVRLAVLGLPLADVNRYDAAEAAPAREPSGVARVLRGPRFAEEACREPYARYVAEAAPGAFAPVTAGGHDPLAEAATGHLRAHTRFLEVQSATTRELAGWLRAGAEGTVDEGFTAAVRAVADHALALTEAHTRAAEAVTGLLRDPGPDAPAGPRPPRPESSVTLPAPLNPRHDETPRPALTALLHGDAPGDPVPDEMAGRSVAEILERCRAVLAEKTGYEPDMLQPELLLQEDLGVDSLKMVELGSELWRHYPSLTREELFGFTEARTLGELAAMFAEKLAAERSALRRVEGNTLGRSHVVPASLPEPDQVPDAFGERPHALLVDDGGDLPGPLADGLRARGWTVRVLALPGVPLAGPGAVLADWSEEALARGLAEALDGVARLGLCAVPFSRSACRDVPGVVERLGHAVLLAKHVRDPLREAAGDGHRAAFVAVTRLDGVCGYAGSGGDPAAASAAGVGGLIKSFALETSSVFCRAVDLAPQLPPRQAADAFLAELGDAATGHREVGITAGHRRVAPELAPCPPPVPPAPAAPPPFTGDDLLLVTGGARGITAWCVRALAEDHRCGYLLLGRTPSTDEEPGWAAGHETAEALLAAATAHPDAPADPAREVRRVLAGRTVRATVRALRRRGVEVTYLGADLLDPAQVSAALAPYARRITGVVHGAGVLGDRPLSQTGEATITPVLTTKVSGLHHVLSALDAARLRHLVVFSSVSGLRGNVRQSDYATANEALNRYARAFAAAHPDCRVTPIAWGPWEGGMADKVSHVFKEAGVPVLTREQGCSAFLDLLRAPREDGDGSVTLVGPTRPLLQVVARVPAAGLTVRRHLAGLEDEPVLRDHRVGGRPLLPMTAAVGWFLHAVEGARGGAVYATGCRDFRITRGLYFDGGHPSHLDLVLRPGADEDRVEVSTAPPPDGADGWPGFTGTVCCAPREGAAPVVPLPALPEAGGLHPAYAAGHLFHGPSLSGLRATVSHEEGRLVVMARMPEPALADGAFHSALFTPGLADLLLQAAGLMWREAPADGFSAPVSVARLELFAPLPDDRPFVIIAESTEVNALDGYCTVTACDPSGRVLQRWHRLRMLHVGEAQAVRMLTAAKAGSRA
ncbi:MULTISPECIES: type I polyketide synthase [Streptomycetaceae]|uniref:Beta keto-acyl synthase n=1 Tax=Streptantibioticus cattleyicolor (strain ATCC 35852 / DSM 46488 / JCM 4925 / NBRC 14057 / NRRL 8057) TaxID=1003195 RepID=F8JTV6_STREN|nr:MULTISPECIES: type I polyketide synthase [Streptomycetaceae]AEW98045.1 beta keto-acyl synthase [Streptantibioticus cattleyicolor NRRL 8057 = DSM 46488]MYS62440.1 type I polyketide synthase [Streptomyces sp. SID5468]CCB78362.1 Putative multi-domain beta-ketoacyl synthase (modular protein) [Streptantibioticus cattleyicolor NRRL 8057 = DSM 46488]